MPERAYDYDRLPIEAQRDIARLEIELYDARLSDFQKGSGILVGLGIMLMLFGWNGRLGAFTFTGDGTAMMYFGALCIVAGIVYAVRSDRANRRSLD